MRRRRRKLDQPGVSLFPFLAVLICTLGVLIVLLVIAVQSASVGQEEYKTAKAEEAAAAEKKKAEQLTIIEALEDQIELQSIRAEGLSAMRPEAYSKLRHAREYRSYLQKEIEALEKQAAQLAAEILVFDKDRKAASTELDESDLQELRKKISSAEYDLLEKRNSVVQVTDKKYSIVPYHGTGGTRRVPIFVECNASGLVLQPWNIRVTKNDFLHPVAAGNPIDAALMVVRNYYEKYNLTETDQRPYPLLVVRPDGAQAYGLARRSLVSWDEEFGYELVSAEKELDFGSIDPQLEAEVREAVENAKRTQAALIRRQAQYAKARRGLGQNGPEGAGNGTGGGLRASSQKGGFVQEGGGRSGKSDPWSSESSGTGDSGTQQASFSGSQKAGQEAARIGSSSKSLGDAIASANANSDAAMPGFNAASSKSIGNNANGNSANGSPFSQASLANQRGANWALPTETAGATGYVRPVTVTCDARQMTIRNVTGERVTISFGTNPDKAIDQMVNIIWQRIDSWGIAGSSAYWKPNLEVNVMPGGKQRFEMLKSMLRGSGLGIEEVSK